MTVQLPFYESESDAPIRNDLFLCKALLNIFTTYRIYFCNP